MKTFRRIFIAGYIIGLAFLFMRGMVFGEDKTTQIIEEIRDKTSKIDSYQVNYVLKTTKDGQTVNSIGRMEFDKPDKFYIEAELPGFEGEKRIFMSDGHTMWEYLPDIEIATKLRLDELKEEELPGEHLNKRYDIRKLFTSMKDGSLKFIKKVSRDDKDIYIIEGEPQDDIRQEAAVEIFQGRIWIDAANGLPEKVVWYDKKGSPAITQEFKDIRINVAIDEATFKFTPPEDVYVMDITEEE